MEPRRQMHVGKLHDTAATYGVHPDEIVERVIQALHAGGYSFMAANEAAKRVSKRTSPGVLQTEGLPNRSSPVGAKGSAMSEAELNNSMKDVKVNPKKSILQKAEETVNGPRAASYGTWEEFADRLSMMWSGYLDHEIAPEHIAPMLVVLKTARLAQNPTHYDSILDVAGYAGCAAKYPTVPDHD